jgi:glycosyltransferase involved in cell wall biosynthesis
MAHGLIRGLSRHHQVDLLSLSAKKVEDYGGLDSCCSCIRIVARVRWHSILRKILGLVAPRPLDVSYSYSNALKSIIAELLSDNIYDVAIFHLSLIGQFLPSNFKGVSILNLEDPTALKEHRLLKTLPWNKKLAALDRAIRFKFYDRALCARFDKAFVLNRGDAEDYSSFLGVKSIDWLPYGIDEAKYDLPANNVRTPGAIILCGNMFHRPNVIAVNYFCKAIFPLIQRAFPGAKLWLVGANPVASVKRWGRDPNIIVTGFVEDMRQYLHAAMVSVCPVTLKIGSQTKVLEAMACGTPVVSTSAGNAGILGENGKHLYIADEPQEFAERVVSLLQGENWNQLSAAGRQFIVTNNTWDVSAKMLEQKTMELISSKNQCEQPADRPRKP